MDLTQTIIAKSDQLNADDLISGPMTFTVTDVRMGDSEQPVSIVLAEWPEGRPFKPSKTVLRILVHAWGKESDEWPEGARMTLYRDPGVKWAGQAVGGIRVSHLSHIDGKLKIALQESKGKKILYTVDPLPDAAPPPDRFAQIAACATAEQVRDLYRQIKADMGVIPEPIVEALTARAAALDDAQQPSDPAQQPTLTDDDPSGMTAEERAEADLA